jgi:hypothetical protein
MKAFLFKFFKDFKDKLTYLKRIYKYSAILEPTL